MGQVRKSCRRLYAFQYAQVYTVSNVIGEIALFCHFESGVSCICKVNDTGYYLTSESDPLIYICLFDHIKIHTKPDGRGDHIIFYRLAQQDPASDIYDKTQYLQLVLAGSLHTCIVNVYFPEESRQSFALSGRGKIRPHAHKIRVGIRRR